MPRVLRGEGHSAGQKLAYVYFEGRGRPARRPAWAAVSGCKTSSGRVLGCHDSNPGAAAEAGADLKRQAAGGIEVTLRCGD
jgi:hypothetical protein